MNKEFLVKCYLVSGLSVSFCTSKEKLENVIKQLEENWNLTVTIGPNSGLNFAFVTHYEIEKVESNPS